MKQWNRLVLFLLLNVLISACTTLTLLILWDRAHDSLIGDSLAILTRSQAQPTAQVTATLSDTPIPAPTPTPAIIVHEVLVGDTFESIASTYNVRVDDLLAENGYTQVQQLSPGDLVRVPLRIVEINSVIGVGDLDLERVVVRSLAQGELLLSGWTLEDGAGNVFTFPQVVIHIQGGSVNVYTKNGANTVLDLYWGLNQPLWASGSTVSLRDSAGTVRATYQIP